MSKIDFFGTDVSWICPEGQLSCIQGMIAENRTGYLTYTNVHVIRTCRNNEILRTALHHACVISPDGMPLAVAGRLAGAHCMAKCSGPDMMAKVLEMGVPLGYTHYFYGSKPETLACLKTQLEANYPGIRIVGMHSPPYRDLTEAEDQEIIQEINTLAPDFIWVGLGAPKQEIWMYNHRNAFNKGLMMGVGAAFDFHAGTLKRAPLWMQRSGLEWFYRLVKEPRRLWKRYFVTNTLFLYYLLRYGVRIVDRPDTGLHVKMECEHNGICMESARQEAREVYE